MNDGTALNAPSSLLQGDAKTASSPRKSLNAKDEVALDDVKEDHADLELDANANGDEDKQMTDGQDVTSPEIRATAPNGDSREDAAAESEAETLITSPVKRREAEKCSVTVKSEKPAKSRIGGLPVPGEDDEDTSTPASPIQSVELGSVSRSHSIKPVNGLTKLEPEEADHDSSSDALSSPRSPGSQAPSHASNQSHTRSGANESSSNSRKRKHRASSVIMPNKRRSMDPPKRLARELTTEDFDEINRSASPKLRSHRRAISIQSASIDHVPEAVSRRRRGESQIPKDSKSSKNHWEESDGSSETASHENNDSKRAPRGIGRSTSTPGRQGGREHKRHINKYGFTRLAEACELGDLEAVKEWRKKDPEQLELAEFAQNKPLQIAALNGNDEIVSYLIGQGCQIDCANVDKDTPLIDAAENGHLETVKILLKAGVDPLRQNLKGQQALDVVTDEIDDADSIRAVIREAIETWNTDGAKPRIAEEEGHRYQAGPSKGLHFMARSYENLLKLVTINDRSGVREFLDARVPVDNAIVAAAAKTGDVYLVNMLLAEMTEKKAFQKAEKPMMAVLGTSHFDMIKALTELDQFNPLYRSRAGKTWPELAEEKNGPNARQEKELLEGLYNAALANETRRSSSPITRRDLVKRGYGHHLDADSAEDEDGNDHESAAKRKNGRRLMSRRDMRAAGGKAASESDTEESSSEPDSPDETEKPASPAPRRASLTAHLRRKSTSSHKAEPTAAVRKKPTPTRTNSEIQEKDEPSPSTQATPVPNPNAVVTSLKTEGEDQLASAQARDGGSSTAKAEAEEARRIAEAEEAQRIENARRDAEEAHAQEIAELARRAEQDKKREEERRKMELENARRQARLDICNSLPHQLGEVLRWNSGFEFRDKMLAAQRADFIIEKYTPLLLVKGGGNSNSKDDDLTLDDSWVVNLQVAPLLGKRGIELLVRKGDSSEEADFAHDWPRYDEYTEREQQNVDSVIRELIYKIQGEEFDEQGQKWIDATEGNTFEYRNAHFAAVQRANQLAIRKLRQGPAVVCCVRLGHVLEHLDPLFVGKSIRCRPLDRSRQNAAIAKELDLQGVDSFVSRYAQGFWHEEYLELRRINGKTQILDEQQRRAHREAFGTTPVKFVQEK